MATRSCCAASLLAAIVVGCSAGPDPSRTILPSLENGRKAVVASMEAWKSGRPTGVVEPTSPRIQVMDTTRRPGQVPALFEVLGVTAGERALTYTVRVELTNPEAVETIRFLVLGVDPVLVWRQEDYDMMSHWEHKMDPIPDEPSP